MKFLVENRPTFVSMVPGNTADRIIELIGMSRDIGCDAVGLQTESLPPADHNASVYREIIASAGDRPVYATHYRRCNTIENVDDDYITEQCLTLAQSGATLVDVMADLYMPDEREITMDETAVSRQMKLIDRLHSMGSEVLMSSHTFRFMPAEEVLSVAREHQRRGADITKIVSGADTIEEEIENLRITCLLKKELDIPFLFLSAGKSHLLRSIGPMIGSCMYLCVAVHDECTTQSQPELKKMRCVYDNFNSSPLDKTGYLNI